MPSWTSIADVAPRAPIGTRAARRWRGRDDARILILACGLAAATLALGLATFATLGPERAVPATDRGALPGVTLDAEPDAARAPPLVVTSLRSAGAAWRGGVRVGDRLEAIDGVPVPGRAALLRALAADPARVIVLRLRRGGGTVDVRLDRGHGQGRHDA